MRKTNETNQKRSTIKSPKHDRELPVTKRLLDLTKQELKGDITTLRLEMRSGFKKNDAKFKNIDARFDAQDAKLEELKTQMTRTLVILEDQNDRNMVVLDAYTVMYEKFVETDSRLGALEFHSFGHVNKK